jgi:hypothetical protein
MDGELGILRLAISDGYLIDRATTKVGTGPVCHLFPASATVCSHVVRKVPKHVANFSFMTDERTRATTVSVSLPDESTPFFRCTFTPARYVPPIPVSRHLPLPTIVQPPLPHPTDDSPILLGCDNWCSIQPTFGGWSRLVWVEPGLDGDRFGDGEAFPDCRPKLWAFNLTDFIGSFPVAQILSDETKKRR